jgi:hypothetical protein
VKPVRTVIQFNVTAKEKRAIQRAAKRAGMTVSEWLRNRRTAGREMWGLIGPHNLPVIYGEETMARKDRDDDEHVVLFRVEEVMRRKS